LSLQTVATALLGAVLIVQTHSDEDSRMDIDEAKSSILHAEVQLAQAIIQADILKKRLHPPTILLLRAAGSREARQLLESIAQRSSEAWLSGEAKRVPRRGDRGFEFLRLDVKKGSNDGSAVMELFGTTSVDSALVRQSESCQIRVQSWRQ
jgi:hypothetical protein